MDENSEKENSTTTSVSDGENELEIATPKNKKLKGKMEEGEDEEIVSNCLKSNNEENIKLEKENDADGSTEQSAQLKNNDNKNDLDKSGKVIKEKVENNIGEKVAEEKVPTEDQASKNCKNKIETTKDTNADVKEENLEDEEEECIKTNGQMSLY